LANWNAGQAGRDFGMYLISEKLLAPEALWSLIEKRDQQLLEADHNDRQAKAPPHNGYHKPAPEGFADGAAGLAKQQHARHSPVNGATASSTPKKSESTSPAMDYAPGDSLESLLKQTMELNASDLHLHSGAALSVRIGGDIHKVRKRNPSIGAVTCRTDTLFYQ